MLAMSTCSSYKIAKYKTLNNNAFVISLQKGLTRQKKPLYKRGLTHSQKFVPKFLINTPRKNNCI